MFKRFMRSHAVQITLGWIVAAWMTLVKYTTRWDVTGMERVQPIINEGKGFIALTWHSRFMMLTSAWKKEWQLPYVLISRSRDGAIVAHTSHFLGLKTIRGSAKKAKSKLIKGGTKAGLEVVDAIEAGGCIVITPDGPRGPRQRLGDGPVRLAKLTGAVIAPCTFAIKNRKQFDSWDKFVLPLPFSKGRIIWGTPVRVPKDANDSQIESIITSIELEMNRYLAEADTSLGHKVVEPAND